MSENELTAYTSSLGCKLRWPIELAVKNNGYRDPLSDFMASLPMARSKRSFRPWVWVVQNSQKLMEMDTHKRSFGAGNSLQQVGGTISRVSSMYVKFQAYMPNT